MTAINTYLYLSIASISNTGGRSNLLVVISRCQSPPKALLPIGLAEAAISALVSWCSCVMNSAPSLPWAT